MGMASDPAATFQCPDLKSIRRQQKGEGPRGRKCEGLTTARASRNGEPRHISGEPEEIANKEEEEDEESLFSPKEGNVWALINQAAEGEETEDASRVEIALSFHMRKLSHVACVSMPGRGMCAPSIF